MNLTPFSFCLFLLNECSKTYAISKDAGIAEGAATDFLGAEAGLAKLAGTKNMMQLTALNFQLIAGASDLTNYGRMNVTLFDQLGQVMATQEETQLEEGLMPEK